MAQNQDKADRIAFVRALMESAGMMVQRWQTDIAGEMLAAADRGVVLSLPRWPRRYPMMPPIITVDLPKPMPLHELEDWARLPPNIQRGSVRMSTMDFVVTGWDLAHPPRPSRGWRRHRRREKAVARRRS